jgi:O-antigen/teichoic acid export membrane protein
MLKNITGTFFTRIIVSVLNFAIIIITAKLMGAEIRGSISLCMLAVAIAGLINEIIGGPAVVYLVPRFNNSSIAKYAYLWAVVISVLSSLLLGLFNFYDVQLFPLVAACSLMLCLGSIHQFILLGHQKIKAFNNIALMQSVILFLVFMSFIFQKQYQIQSYFYALLIAYAAAFLLGLKYTSFVWKNEENITQKPTLKILFNNGILTQLASLTHLMSSRVTFYFSSHFLSLAFVGVLSTALSITEAAMLFSSSVALITASTVSNETNKLKAASTALKLIKLSLLISFVILFVLSVFPETLMSTIFGKDFSGIKIIILTLIPGALANSISQVISHYYSGLGKFKINAAVGFLSLAVSIFAGILYLKTSSILLPGFIISSSAIVAMIYFVRLFLKEHQWKAHQLLPNKADVKLVFEKFKNKLR